MKKVIRKNILLIEDDDLFLESMNDILVKNYHIQAAKSAEEAQNIFKKSLPDLILLDINLPGMDGIELLKQIKASWPGPPVIMLTAIDRVPTVVESMKLGAYDYLTKPIRAKELSLAIARALESSEIRRELEQRRELQLATNKEYRLIGISPALEKIRKEIQIVGESDATVLIEGETGTGKELVARAIHACSPRASGPFVALNCGAIPKDLMESELFGHKKGAFTGAQKDQIGKFQLANHGTLLLDEIGELPAEAQIKLLRVLEEQEFYPVGSTGLVRVDVRIIASTNSNLGELMEKKSFREDLFFRLNVYSIIIPPLREQPEDILPLAEHFIKQFNQKFDKCFQEISSEAKEILLKHPWKGNVRELRNLIERIILYEEDRVITKAHLGFGASPVPAAPMGIAFEISERGLDLELAEIEKKIIRRALELARWNRTEAAKLLRLSPPALYYRLEKHGLN